MVNNIQMGARRLVHFAVCGSPGSQRFNLGSSMCKACVLRLKHSPSPLVERGALTNRASRFYNYHVTVGISLILGSAMKDLILGLY